MYSDHCRPVKMGMSGSHVNSRDAGSAAQARRSEARRQAKRRHARKRIMQAGGVLVAALVIGLGAAWLLRDSSTPDEAVGQALHQFDTADYHSLVFDPNDPDTLFFGHHYGLMVSRDAGLTWDDGTLGEHDAMQQGIALDASRHYVAGHNVFQVSDDGGQTWRDRQSNLPALDIHGFAVAPSDPDRLYALEVVSGGFYSSRDGGASWEQLPLPPGLQTAMLPMAVSYDDPEHLFVTVGTDVLESLDGGESWIAQPGPGRTVVSLALMPDDPQRMLVGTVEGLWLWDVDVWRKLPLTVDGAVLAIAVHPTMTERIAVIDQQGNFYRSDDAGATWVTAP